MSRAKTIGLVSALLLIVFCPHAAAQSYQAVFICPQSFAEALAPLVADAQSDGWQVDVFTIESIEAQYPGPDRREKIKAAVADLKAHGLEVVCFVGDADYSGQEPQYDIIPLWYYHCPEIGFWREDRATMIDYVDIDGDRIPDVAWTWIPANSAEQVENLVSNSLYYKSVDPQAEWLGKCLWLVEDEDLDGNSGAITRKLADSLINARGLSGFSKIVLYDSEIPCCYFNREQAAVAEIDAGTGAVFGFGTSSNRTNFVQFMAGYFYFTVSERLAENEKCSVYFGISCGLGEFDRPPSGTGIDLCSQFLFDNENKGASFWVGPSGNTRYYSNYYFAAALVEQLFERGAQTTAEACFLALRRVMLEHPEYQQIWETFNFFGSPFHVIHGMRAFEYVDAGGTTPFAFGLHQNYPNPFNPATIIAYSLAAKCRVRLNVYNVSGRLVRTLVDEVQEAGYKNVIWDGLDAYGRSVVSGIYFYRLEAGDFIASKKLVLIR